MAVLRRYQSPSATSCAKPQLNTLPGRRTKPSRVLVAVNVPSPATSFGLSMILMAVGPVTTLPSLSKAICVVPWTSPAMSSPPDVPFAGETASTSIAPAVPV